MSACSVVLLATCPALWAAPSQWQGGPASGQSTEAPVARGERWLLLDTGGSGGMFGKGDLRAKLRDVAFWTDGRHGVACGHTGAFYTSDGGLNWRRVRKNPRRECPGELGIIYYFTGISGPRELWLAEGKHPAKGRRLWHSLDAGDTWEDVADRLPGPLESIWGLLVRGPHVWVLGGWSPKASCRSCDRGQTWTPMTLPNGFEPYAVTTPMDQPRDAVETVYLLGAVRERRGDRRPKLLRSDDAGETWQAVALPADACADWQFNHATIAFGTRGHGWLGLDAAGLTSVGHGHLTTAPGATASILATADGGQTWQRRSLPPNEFFISSLCLLPDGCGYAAVWNGFVRQRGGPRNGPAMYCTPDGGKSWQVVFRGARQVNDIFALDRGRLWAVGDVVGFQANDLVAIRQP